MNGTAGSSLRKHQPKDNIFFLFTCKDHKQYFIFFLLYHPCFEKWSRYNKWQQWHCYTGISKELKIDRFYSLSSSTSHSKHLRGWVMCCTAELKYFACFPWNMLKDAVDRTWHSKRLLSLPKMWCIISFFQHKELKRQRKEKGKELHVVTYHPGWKIILFLFHFEAFTLDIQSSLCGGKKAGGQMLTCSPTAPCLEEMCPGAAKLEHLKNICGMAGHPCAWQQCWDEGAGFPNSHILILWSDSWFPLLKNSPCGPITVSKQPVRYPSENQSCPARADIVRIEC